MIHDVRFNRFWPHVLTGYKHWGKGQRGPSCCKATGYQHIVQNMSNTWVQFGFKSLFYLRLNHEDLNYIQLELPPHGSRQPTSQYAVYTHTVSTLYERGTVAGNQYKRHVYQEFKHRCAWKWYCFISRQAQMDAGQSDEQLTSHRLNNGLLRELHQQQSDETLTEPTGKQKHTFTVKVRGLINISKHTWDNQCSVDNS